MVSHIKQLSLTGVYMHTRLLTESWWAEMYTLLFKLLMLILPRWNSINATEGLVCTSVFGGFFSCLREFPHQSILCLTRKKIPQRSLWPFPKHYYWTRPQISVVKKGHASTSLFHKIRFYWITQTVCTTVTWTLDLLTVCTGWDLVR